MKRHAGKWRSIITNSGRVSTRERILSKGILAPQMKILWRELPPRMNHRFPEDSPSALEYNGQVPLRAHRLYYRRVALNRVPGDPFLSVKSLGQVSLRAYWYQVSVCTCWPSESLLSGLRSRTRPLSDRRFREVSLADPQQQMMQHPSSEDRCSRREAEISQRKAESSRRKAYNSCDFQTFGYCGQNLGCCVRLPAMVKSLRESENPRRSPRSNSTSSRLKKEEHIASQTCSPGSMKGDTSVDPTE